MAAVCPTVAASRGAAAPVAGMLTLTGRLQGRRLSNRRVSPSREPRSRRGALAADSVPRLLVAGPLPVLIGHDGDRVAARAALGGGEDDSRRRSAAALATGNADGAAGAGVIVRSRGRRPSPECRLQASSRPAWPQEASRSSFAIAAAVAPAPAPPPPKPGRESARESRSVGGRVRPPGQPAAAEAAPAGASGSGRAASRPRRPSGRAPRPPRHRKARRTHVGGWRRAAAAEALRAPPRSPPTSARRSTSRAVSSPDGSVTRLNGSVCRARRRDLHSLRAIVPSHAEGSRGSWPASSPRYAERNVC